MKIGCWVALGMMLVMESCTYLKGSSGEKTILQADTIQAAENKLENDTAMVACNVADAGYLKDKSSELVVEAISSWKLERIMLVDPMKNVAPSIHGCSIVAVCDTVSKEQSVEIRSLLLDSDSYKQSQIVKNATFLPDYACRFVKGDEVVDVLVALYCDDIKVYHLEKEFTLDITPSHTAFASFIKQVFPNDKYIKKY